MSAGMRSRQGAHLVCCGREARLDEQALKFSDLRLLVSRSMSFREQLREFDRVAGYPNKENNDAIGTTAQYTKKKARSKVGVTRRLLSKIGPAVAAVCNVKTSTQNKILLLISLSGEESAGKQLRRGLGKVQF